MKLKVEILGDETVVILPQEMVTRLNLDPGATSLDAELTGSGLRLFPHKPVADRGSPDAVDGVDA